jgi:hypothetical protein
MYNGFRRPSRALQGRETYHPLECSLTAFLLTEQGRRWFYSKEFYSRLLDANIKSRTALERWMRQRYPEAYHNWNFINEATGRETLQRLWADYLKWSEA